MILVLDAVMGDECRHVLERLVVIWATKTIPGAWSDAPEIRSCDSPFILACPSVYRKLGNDRVLPSRAPPLALRSDPAGMPDGNPAIPARGAGSWPTGYFSFPTITSLNPMSGSRRLGVAASRR